MNAVKVVVTSIISAAAVLALPSSERKIPQAYDQRKRKWWVVLFDYIDTLLPHTHIHTFFYFSGVLFLGLNYPICLAFLKSVTCDQSGLIDNSYIRDESRRDSLDDLSTTMDN